jgi:DNA-binding response OmpR family regulator
LAGVLLVVRQRTKRVLLVDDAPDITEAIGNGLRGKGYRVDAFNDPSIALASFKPQSYDIAILDVRMSPIDGLELYRRLRGLDRNLVVLFLTAYADVIKERPNRIRFLQKPISLGQLVQALKEP